MINEKFVLSPAFSAVAMSVSSVLVVSNSLRLLAAGNKCFGKLVKNAENCCENEIISGSRCSISGGVCDIINSGENSARTGINGGDESLCENGACEADDRSDIDREGDANMVKTTVEVNGMMCHNCERHVNNAVKAAFDVVSVESNHETKQTVIVTKDAIDEAKLRAVIAEEGYETGKIVFE